MMAATDTSLAIATIQKLRTVATTRGAMQESVIFYKAQALSLFNNTIIYGCVTAMSTFLLLGMWLVNVNGEQPVGFQLRTS